MKKLNHAIEVRIRQDDGTIGVLQGDLIVFAIKKDGETTLHSGVCGDGTKSELVCCFQAIAEMTGQIDKGEELDV